MTGYWTTTDGDAATGGARRVWVHVPDPTYAERQADLDRTQLRGPQDLYRWLRYGDDPDAIELAATEEGIAIRHGGATFGSAALTFPTAAFTAFLTTIGLTPTGDLADLLTTAQTMETTEAARRRARYTTPERRPGHPTDGPAPRRAGGPM